MSDRESCLPVIDCCSVGLNVNQNQLTEASVKLFGEDLKYALETTGFCYLKNHGVDKGLVENYMESSRVFFAKPDEVKRVHLYGKDKFFGWVAAERERINLERPGDLKESFNYYPADDDNQWPDVEDFQKYSQLMFNECTQLAKRILRGLSVSLGLEQDFMSNAHNLIGTKNNATILRTLYYPPITQDTVLKPGQIRLGEHSDFGTISLLFKDDIGGLEADLPGKGFVPLTPIPDTVVVIIGDLMQRWTSDAMTATRHRVLFPEEGFRKRKSRQSIVFFLNPDANYILAPLDGSDKYKPVTTKEFLHERINATL